MLLLAAALALALLKLDSSIDPGMRTSIAWAYSGGPEGARSLLSTIAGSMITAASVTFSLASVALSIASQQYGSRVLRNFMRDRITQVLLGTFVSTFIYSVLVVRSIRGSEFSGFVPAISITVAILLSLVSLLMLIYFVHHVSSSIQASHIVKVIAEDLQTAIPKLYPSSAGLPFPAGHKEERFRSRKKATICAGQSGYLQAIDLDLLLKVAAHENLIIEIALKPGDHAIADSEIALAWTNADITDPILDKVAGAFEFGGQRTPAQDVRYPFQQLTDVIVRALSPGINDPFTAINGIDELASGLFLLSSRHRIEEWRQDQSGELRVLVPRPTIYEILWDTVGHIAIYAAGDHFVMDRLRRVLDIVKPNLQTDTERREISDLSAELDRRQKAKADAS